LLMLGTGIASADEDVNPDRPSSPLDTPANNTTALGRDINFNGVDDVTRDIPVLGQLVEQVAGNGVNEAINQALTDTAEGLAQDVTEGLAQGEAAAPTQTPTDTVTDTATDTATQAAPTAADAIPDPSADRPFTVDQATDWIAPIRVDSGSIGLTGQEAQADGVVGDNRYGLTTDLRSVRELADLGDLPTRLHQAGADLSGTGDSIGDELIDISGGLIEASQNQAKPSGPGLLTGDLTVVPDQNTTKNTAGDQPADSGEGGALVQGIATPVADSLPIFDVPADVLSRALTRFSQISPLNVADGSHINLPVNRLEAVPTQLPTLLPLGRSLLREDPPVTDPLDDVAGVFSGVLANLTDRVTGERTIPAQPRILPGLAPNITNPFGPITGDLFGRGSGSAPIAGDLFNIVQTAQSNGLLPQSSVSRMDTVVLPAILPAPGHARTLPAIVPSVTDDLDVTQIVPTIPSLGDLRAPSLRAMPAMAGFPAVDPSTLTDTRAALASLFNRPIG